ncbi:MAG: nitrate/nitrite transporter [Fulvivirga sp.]
MKPGTRELPLIIISQFCCTSLWFASNGVMNDLVTDFSLEEGALGYLTSAVQFGFISGTLCFAIFTIADRFSPSKVFLVSALLAAVFNLGTIIESNTLWTLTSFRFFTGFFLAGIYPVGMKIAADYHKEGLGKALGYLVGALVLGTALPHLLKGLTAGLSWKLVLFTTSILAVLGGMLTGIFVKDGPSRRAMQKMEFSTISEIFKNASFRSAAFGYFGHMWELYAFWAFVPVILGVYLQLHPDAVLDVPILSFAVIAIGGLACIMGGYVSLRVGARKTAIVALSFSGLCCLISPLIIATPSTIVFIAFLFFWGMVVIADSPMFSTLVAHSAASETKGTALTIVNCIGFSITIVSIQLLSWLSSFVSAQYLYMTLAAGPILGFIAVYKKP